MIFTLLTMIAIQAETIKRPMTVRPSIDIVAKPIARRPTLAEGRALVARAEAFNASYAPGAGGPSKAELQASIDRLKADLDSMSEMGETESLRMQMAMDRMSKLMSTLSNLLKKASDTQQSITQNIK